MTLASDPKYRVLAATAAKVLGTSDLDIIAAILAQWTCEKGNADAYPPSRNNPGNLARGALGGLGLTFTIQYPNPQPGNPIVTFATPTYGATAYGKYIRANGQVGERYAGVMSAVRAGNGHDYIIEMGQSGYGTSTACMLSAYHPAAPPTDKPPVKEARLNLHPGIVYKTAILCKAGANVLNEPNGSVIYKTKAGDKFPEVGDYISGHGDYHVMRMPGDIAGYIGHGLTNGTVPI